MGKSFFAVAAMALGASAQLFPANSSTAAVGPTGTGPVGTGVLPTVIDTTSSALPTGNATTVAPSTSSGFTNATTTASSSAAPTASDPVFCPALSGSLYAGPLSINYQINCDVNRGGLLIDIDIALAKRQSTVASSLQDCLQVCSTLPTCVATAFDTNNPQCFFYSSLSDPVTANGIEFALKQNSTSSSSTLASSSTAPFATGNASTSAIGTGSSSTIASPSSTVPSASASATATSSPDLFCPNLNAQIFVTPSGVEFLLECGLNHVGVIIEVTATLAKRQANAPASLGDCLNLCAATARCVGTGFNTVQRSCTLFSSIGAAYSAPDVEFGVVVAPAVTVTPGQQITSTLYATTVRTVSSCAPTVTNCPLGGGVVTEVIPVSSTVYICPTLTTIPALPVACTACPYAPRTATVYSQTVQTIYSCAPDVVNCPYTSGPAATTVTTYPAGYTLTTGGVTTVLTASSAVTTAVNVATQSGVTVITTTAMVPASTVVVNHPAPTSTGAQATGTASVVTVPGSGSSAGTATTKAASSTTTGPVVFTGAANALAGSAGMAGAMVAAVALLI